jgi:hypothetical protein
MSEKTLQEEMKMKPAIELIINERHRKSEHHGFDMAFIKANSNLYDGCQLQMAASFAITLDSNYWPYNWNDVFKKNIQAMSYKERLVVAAAFLADEIDRANLVDNESSLIQNALDMERALNHLWNDPQNATLQLNVSQIQQQTRYLLVGMGITINS